jgi:MarR family transcriptional regulator for hemolysin
MSTQLEPKHAEAGPTAEPNLCLLLKRASHALNTRIAAAVEGLGVSPRGLHVLEKALTGEYTQTELARMIGLDKTTMVVTVDQLEAGGFAERRPAPADRRARVIAVTEAGRRKVEQGREIADRIHEELLATLPEEYRRVLIESLSRLVDDPLADPVSCEQPVRRPRI